MSLQHFLDNKPLYYTEIDYTRMPRVYAKVKDNFQNPKIIHLVGTNGKGTTGRFLASALHRLGYSVGHYTSPHILKFNERIWINAQDIDDESLEKGHSELLSMLTKEDSDSLSYFEYTTLLAMLLFQKCEYVVLEAGLGGEYDATAVFKKNLTLVTPIGFDHESFLGNSIEAIAQTKLNAIQNNAILAEQKFEEVYGVAKCVQEQKALSIYRVQEYINQDDVQKIEQIASRLSLANYLQQNLKLAIAALKFLDIAYDVSSFENSLLFGRLSRLSKNVLLDVGHNPLAAKSIYESLYPQKFTLIYNSYKDKEYAKILEILQPIISNVEIIDIEDERIESKEQLQRVLTHLEIEYETFESLREEKNYLVFGSFAVAEAFLKVFSE